MEILFSVRDPLGNMVVLDKICLEKHILVNHPIIHRYKNRISNTIQKPDAIYKSKTDGKSLLYYRKLNISPRPKHLMVVASPDIVKDVLYINQLWVGIPRGFLGILASWSVFGNPLQPLPMSIGFIAMLFLIGGSITKDVTDSYADKKTGTRTLVNTFGVKKAAFMALPFMFFPFVMIPILINSGILESYFWLLTSLAIPGYLVFYLMMREDKESKFTLSIP